MDQEGETGHLRPVLATRYTPDRRLFGFSKQFLEGEFSEVRLTAILGISLTARLHKSGRNAWETVML